MLRITDRDTTAMEIEVRGTLDRDDYEQVIPQLEEAAEDGALRVILRLEEFQGWTPGALLEDLRFDIRHRNDFEKIAVVGEKKLEEWGTKVTKPFFSGEVEFFESLGAARAWMAEPDPGKARMSGTTSG